VTSAPISSPPVLPGDPASGFRLLPGLLGPNAQRTLLRDILAVLAKAPAFQPVMPGSGRPLSVRMSNCGPLGWVSDRQGGYRYQAHHPATGAAWPPIPDSLLQLWTRVTEWPQPPEACLVNLYGPGARMGLHVDADEDARDAPVLSVSLGDTALFRLGGPRRGDPTRSVRLASGDALVLGGASRHWYHGVDKVLTGSSRLASEAVPGVGRINLTLRRVTR
jgi:alkylated DNA repair protein (DNA oxidative demethylase)